jgi:acetylornithine deacetylase
LDQIRRFSTDEIEAEMKKVNPSCGIVFTEQFSYPGLSLAPDAEVVTFVQSLLDSKTAPGKTAFGTEAGLYQKRCGIPTVVCGPGDIANAHQADEYLDASQLAACDLLLGRLAAALAG